MKRRVLVQVDQGTHDAWKSRAFSEGRSMSELARDLIERAVFTEGDHDAVAVESRLGVSRVAPSASAVPAAVQTVPVEKNPGPRSWSLPSEREAAAYLALRDGKCSADVAQGTKCKLCGEVHK